MADGDLNEGSRQPVAQPAVASPVQGEPASDPSKPITAAEFEKRIGDLTKILESHTQGLVDKNLRRVDKGVAEVMKKVDELVSLAKKSGVEMNDAQIQQLKDRATLEALQNDTTSADSAQPPVVQPVKDQEPLDPVAGAALAIMRKRGVFVEESDPEISLVDRNTDDPQIFIESITKAIDAKVKRMSQQLGTPAAVPGVVAQGAPVTTDLQAQYQKELAEIRQGDVEGLFQLQKKYREKGLRI